MMDAATSTFSGGGPANTPIIKQSLIEIDGAAHGTATLMNSDVSGAINSSGASQMLKTPVFHPLIPGINLRSLPRVEAHERMIKLRAALGQLDCQLFKIMRREPTEPDLKGKRLALEKERLSTFQCMEALEMSTGMTVLFSPASLPDVIRDDSPTVGHSAPSGGRAPLASAGADQISAQVKRPLEDESDSGSKTNDQSWTEVKTKISKKTNSNLTKNVNVTKKIKELKISDPDDINDMDTTLADAAKQTPRKERIPPFHIIPPPGWHVLLSQIRNLVPTFKSQSKGKFLKITVENEEDFRKIQRFFRERSIQFKAFLLDSEKPVKVIVRGFPINTETSLIKTALEIEGFNDVAVTQLYRGSVTNKKYMPLFLCNIPKSNQQIPIDEIFQLTELFGTQVQFEVYKGKKGPSQCFNCQGFFHSAVSCNLPSRCVKCAGEHKTRDCPKKFEEPCRCTHCGGDHPANFRNCPRFPKTIPKTKNKNKNSKPSKPINHFKIVQATSQSRQFSSRPVNQTRTYSGIATGHSEVAAPPKTNIQTKIQSVPSTGADSATDFINLLLAFEKSYAPAVVLSALEKALPALRVAPTEVDRIAILYRSILQCSGTSVG